MLLVKIPQPAGQCAVCHRRTLCSNRSATHTIFDVVVRSARWQLGRKEIALYEKAIHVIRYY